MNNSVFLLWLEGINPESLEMIPSLSKLVRNGVDVRLSPLPLVEVKLCYYQALTGMGPARLGRFDSVRLEGYKVCQDTSTPEGALGHLLPDMLRSRNLTVTSLEIRDSDELNLLARQKHDFTLIRLLDAGTLSLETLDAVVRRCLEVATPSAHIMVMTDVWSASPKAFVNVNDFLAEKGLLEVSGSGIVWPETLAYGLGTGQIWINLRGREPQGVVSTGREYQEVCEALIRELRTNWLDPQTNQPVVEHVFRKDEIFEGDYMFKAPDLITVYRSGYVASEKAFALELDGESVITSGNADGAQVAQAPFTRLIASGPSLTCGHTEQAKLIDVVPTTMYALGQPIPYGVDGKVVSSLFTQAYMQLNPIERADDDKDMLSDEEEGMIVDRLRDLGYLG